MEDFLIGAFVFIFVMVGLALLWLSLTLFGGLLLTWAWNLLMPTLWHAAPMLSYWQGVAGVVLLQVLGNLFKFTVNNHGGNKE